MSKKVLVMGGTGAMGVYVVPELLKKGYKVDVLSLDDIQSDNPNLRYFVGNGHDHALLSELFKNNYDGIIDFMIYNTEDFRQNHEFLLSHTGHYIYLSSYRVYADDCPITEESRQLLDASTDEDYLAHDDYSLYKARGEDILEASPYRNWTAVRPAITYSHRRYQLVILEADSLITRAREGKPVLLPEEARNVQATMSWAGDVAKMFAAVLFNEEAKCQHYTFATAEHQTWGTIAGYYEELIGLKVKWISREEFLNVMAADENGYKSAKWQLDYDRLFDRVVDNSKICKLAGLKQSEFMTLKEGLKLELSNLPADAQFPNRNGRNERMDAYLAAHGE